MKYFMILCLLTASLQVQSQNAIAKNAFFAHFLVLDYQSEPNTDIAYVQNLTLGIEGGYSRNLGKNWLNFVLPLRAGVIKRNSNSLDNYYLFGGDAMLQYQYYRQGALITPQLHSGIGFASEDKVNLHAEVPIGLGFKLGKGPQLYLSGKAEYRISLDNQYGNNFQYGLGLLWSPVKTVTHTAAMFDTDKDGIADTLDKCPLFAGLLVNMGCPDTDGDGIFDHKDLCPDKAGLREMEGCPDSDYDGVPDPKDQCPDKPGLKNLNGCPDKDNDGVTDMNDKCPDEKGSLELMGCPDKDGDGIIDSQDKCPDVVGVASMNGCPEPKDADQDGIDDAMDRCPTEAGTKLSGGCPDKDGDGVADGEDKCPDKHGPALNKGCPVLLEEDKAILDFAMRNIQFETKSSNLKAESYNILDQVAQLMKNKPAHTMSIEGHTDNIGADAANLKLSEDRARSCYDYLISRGIATNRLSYKGYGKTRPRATNDTAEGRQTNRRVEFIMSSN